MLAHLDEPERVVSMLKTLRASTPHTIVVRSVLLDELHAIRANGYAFDREETKLGLTCAAAPIVDALGRPVAAISVAGPVGRFDSARHIPAIVSAAKSIALAYHG
jgi:DNA-binding IclR family transcriptional regulator